MPPAAAPQSRELNRQPSVTALIVPPSTGEHVYRVQLRASNGKYLAVDPTNVIAPRSEDVEAPETIFEFHRYSDDKFAIRTAIGKFFNVDDTVDLVLKDKPLKDNGLRADREPSTIGIRERSFTLRRVISVDAESSPSPATDAITIGIDGCAFAVDAEEGRLKLCRQSDLKTDDGPRPTSASASASAAASHATSATPAAVTPVSSSSSVSTPAPFAHASSITPAKQFHPIWLDGRNPLMLMGRVIIQTVHDRYWCCEPSGHLVANRTHISLWEPMVIQPLDLEHVAIMSAHGSYLAVQDDGRSVAFSASDTTHDGVRLRLIELDLSKGLYAFQANNGRFLSAPGNHSIDAASKSVSTWETLRIRHWNQTV